ncbi:MAG: hypothetical protein A2X77_00040 [Gammaproteobacteria bacterium GWE2_42_36]|nr:MAG: hypothetical protein A2X77_00040 [Gammaproteobacteria bacterium GWE2_42_36]HCU04971.1 hypothetical protein [Coxiellaceae bacterium]
MQTIVATRAKITVLTEAYQQEMSQIEKDIKSEEEALDARTFAEMRKAVMELVFVFNQAANPETRAQINIAMLPNCIPFSDLQPLVNKLMDPRTDLQGLFRTNLAVLQELSMRDYLKLTKERGAFYDEVSKSVTPASGDRLGLFTRSIQTRMQQEIQKQLSDCRILDADGRFNLSALSEAQIKAQLIALEAAYNQRAHEEGKQAVDMYEKQEACQRRFLDGFSTLPLLPVDSELIRVVISGEVENLKSLLKCDKTALNRPLYDSSKLIYGKTLLYLACEYGQLPVIEYLLANNARADIPEQQDGYYPIQAIFMPRAGNDAHIAEAKWASPETERQALDLLQAAWKKEQKKNPGMIALIELHGAYHRTLLHTAVRFRDLTGLAWLFECGAEKLLSIQESTPEHLLPLQVAVKSGDMHVADFLLTHHADPHAMNRNEESALMMAHYCQREDLIKLFSQYGHTLSFSEIQAIDRGKQRGFVSKAISLEEIFARQDKVQGEMRAEAMAVVNAGQVSQEIAIPAAAPRVAALMAQQGLLPSPPVARSERSGGGISPQPLRIPGR